LSPSPPLCLVSTKSIQNGDILAPANTGLPGKMAVKTDTQTQTERERDREREREYQTHNMMS